MPSPTHRLSAEIDPRGYSLEYFIEDSTAAGAQPCLTRVTVTYEGDDPGGVTQWTACGLHDPGLALPLLDGAWAASGSAPSFGECYSFDPDFVTPSSETQATGLQVVSSSSTELVLDCWVRYAAKPGSQGGGPWDGPSGHGALSVMGELLMVNAKTAGGDWESLSWFVDCEQWSPVTEAGHFVFAEASDRHCRSRRWIVGDVVDAGPFVMGGSPSDEGKMVTVLSRACRGGEVELEDEDDCCTLDEGDIEAWEGVTNIVGEFSVLPPRDGAVWERGLATPAVRIRWPVHDPESFEIDHTASEADPDYGSETPGALVVYEVFLGRCAVYLATTPTLDWDTAANDGVASTLYQDDALVGYLGAESDVGVGSTIGDESPEDLKKSYVTGVVVKATTTSCTDCCTCNPDSTPQELIYDFADEDSYFTCTQDDYAEVLFGTYTRTPKATKWWMDRFTLREGQERLECGEIIGVVPSYNYKEFPTEVFMDVASIAGLRRFSFLSPLASNSTFFDADDASLSNTVAAHTPVAIGGDCEIWADEPGPGDDYDNPVVGKRSGNGKMKLEATTTLTNLVVPNEANRGAAVFVDYPDAGSDYEGHVYVLPQDGEARPGCLEFRADGTLPALGPFDDDPQDFTVNVPTGYEPSSPYNQTYTEVSGTYSRSVGKFLRVSHVAPSTAGNDYCVCGEIDTQVMNATATVDGYAGTDGGVAGERPLDQLAACGGLSYATVKYRISSADFATWKTGKLLRYAPGTTEPIADEHGYITICVCVPSDWLTEAPSEVHYANGRWETTSLNPTTTGARTSPPASVAYVTVLTDCVYCLPVSAINGAGGTVTVNDHDCYDFETPWPIVS